MANPTLLDMPIARDGAKNSIPSTTSPTTGLLSQQFGWQDINSMPVQQGGKAPSRLDFNGVLNLLSNILFYAQKGWQFEWDSNQAYYAGCIVKDTSDGKMYQCLNDVTSTTAPHSDSTNWKLWDLSQLANYLPLAGGNMTGSIGVAGNSSIARLKGFSYNSSDFGEGASIELYGNSHYTGADDYRNGRFIIIAGGKDTDEPTKERHTALECTRGGSLLIQHFFNNTLQYSRDLGGSAIVSANFGPWSGYIKNARGLILQWGAYSTASFTNDGNGGCTYNFSFPLTFSVKPIGFATWSVSGFGGKVGLASFYAVSTSQGMLSSGLPNDQISDINWFAIGY